MTKTKSEPTMRILQKHTCETITGSAGLTFELGCDTDSVVHLRITKNSGGGFFSNEWIAYEDIQAALKKRLKGQAITSFLLIPLFKGKSANNSSFLLATLKHLKLVQPLPKKKREFEQIDPQPFLDQVAKLMSSPVKTKTTKKKTAAKKATIKKASVKKAAIKKRAITKRKKSSA